MEREEGYYWLKSNDELPAPGEWVVGHWIHGSWTFPGSEERYEDSDDLELSEGLIPPE